MVKAMVRTGVLGTNNGESKSEDRSVDKYNPSHTRCCRRQASVCVNNNESQIMSEAE